VVATWVTQLSLTASPLAVPTSWRWTLADDQGTTVAEHQVSLDDAAWQFQALTDLSRYARDHSNGVPDDEARIVTEVGDWIGEHIFGPLGAILVDARPAIVSVLVPGLDSQLAMLPLESARIGGVPLPLHRVTLVTVSADETAAAARWPDQIDDQLRVLALFQVPDGAQALNQRRERQKLAELLAKEGATKHVAIKFSALQYGVTAGRLRSALELDPGWDAIHVSGYAAATLLELTAGQDSLAPIKQEALIDLLDLIRGRLKLVTIAACTSSSAPVSSLQPPQSLPSGQLQAADDGWLASGLPAARKLSERLGCAVVTVRFPVTEDFARAYFLELYRLTIVSGQSLADAAAMASVEVARASPPIECPASALTAPAVFGSRAVRLKLAAPPGKSVIFNPFELQLAGFTEPPPERFVGRDDVMRRASIALAPGSGFSGVLVHGMPGAGKTSCLLELAYSHDALDVDGAFPVMIWHRVSTDAEKNIKESLQQFAQSIEDKIEGFPLSGVLDDEEALKTRLAMMTEYFKRQRVLVVLDNIEPLLAPNCNWRDERWGLVIDALTSHDGLSRLLISSRQAPARLDPKVLPLPIVPLGPGDATLLARDLPHLRGLLDGTAQGIDPADARALAWRILSAARGNPKLLELADGAVSHSGQIDRFLADATTIWSSASDGQSPGGGAAGEDADYLRVLECWIEAITTSVAASTNALFQLLCCMDEADRAEPVITDNWAELQRDLGLHGDPPAFADEVTLLRERGLVTVELDATDAVSSLQVHPAVAEYGRRHTDVTARHIIDGQLTAYWLQRTTTGDTAATVPAIPYVSRLIDSPEVRQILGEQTLSALAALLNMQGIAIPDGLAQVSGDTGAGDDPEPAGLANTVLDGFTRLTEALRATRPAIGEEET
jgi:hypothetical protein